MSTIYSIPAARVAVLDEKWQTHPFYQSAVVLGLDVGLEGIGVCVRRGREILYAKTWLYDVPAAARLEDRRQRRGARHCRANRKTRLHRLDALFKAHGLPAFGEPEPGAVNPEQSSRAWFTSDPYELRFRAIKETNAEGQATKPLASKISLAIAVRHCVAHRGHDYEYFSDEGQYPWGDSSEFDKVKKALLSVWLIEKEAERPVEIAKTSMIGTTRSVMNFGCCSSSEPRAKKSLRSDSTSTRRAFTTTCAYRRKANRSRASSFVCILKGSSLATNT